MGLVLQTADELVGLDLDFLDQFQHVVLKPFPRALQVGAEGLGKATDREGLPSTSRARAVSSSLAGMLITFARLGDRAADASGHQIRPARCSIEPVIAGSMLHRAGPSGGSATTC